MVVAQATMASLFAGKSRNDRPYGHGGLGGLRSLDTLAASDPNNKQRFSVMRKRKPSPVSTSLGDGDISFTTMTPASIILHDFRTPSRPSTPRVTQSLKPTLEDEREFLKLEALGPRVTEVLEITAPSLPSSPSKPIHRAFTAVELPGSILLPNGGIPEPLLSPSTPTRTGSNRSSDDTLIGSPPDLTPSSPTTENKMDKLRGLASKKLKDDEYLGKPFHEMRVEEMLEALPELPAKVINDSWIPVMAAKRAESLIQLRAYENRDKDKQQDFSAFFEVSMSFPFNTYFCINADVRFVLTSSLVIYERCTHRVPRQSNPLTSQRVELKSATTTSLSISSLSGTVNVRRTSRR